MKAYIGRYPHDSAKTRKVRVRADEWDAWSADNTIALLAVPILKELAKQKQGVPVVVFPEGDEWLDEDGNHTEAAMAVASDKWDTILRHIIWSLEQCIDEEFDDFCITRAEIDFDDHPEDEGKNITPLRWKVKGEYRHDAMDAYEGQIQVGLDYFGKYFRNLWS